MRDGAVGARWRFPAWWYDPTTAIAMLLIAIQLGFRGWASFNGWFYSDDFEFLTEATGTPLTLDHVMTPHDSQLMPGGVLAIWAVAQAGTYAWWAAASFLVALQAIASAACWVMLTTLFPGRQGRLVLLALYLFSTLTLSAFMWWSAAINQLPVHAALFLAVTFMVRHLEKPSATTAVATIMAVGIGLLFYVKAILIVLPVVGLTILVLRRTNSSWGRTLLDTVRRPWRVWVAMAPLALFYTAYYTARVPSPVVSDGTIDYPGLVDAMLRRTLGPGLLGGPWRWDHLNPPLSTTATPEWAVNLSWVAIGVAVVLLVRDRRLSSGGLLIAVPYLGMAVLLTAAGRGAQLGGFAGLEPRYLADSLPVLVLALGVSLWGPPTQTRHRIDNDGGSSTPDFRWVVPLVALSLGAGYSNVDYVRSWTSPFPAEQYVKNVAAQSRSGPLLIADQPVPEAVMSATSYPSNLPSRLFLPLGDSVEAVTSGTDLEVLDTGGTVQPGVVTPGATSLPGPVTDCGYPITSRPRAVPVEGRPQDYFWWMQIAYLSGGDGSVWIEQDGVSQEYEIAAGLHRLFVQGEGTVDDLSIRVPPGQSGLCIDTVLVGNLEAFVIQ